MYTLEFGVYAKIAGQFEFLPVTLPGQSEPVTRLNLGQVRLLDSAHPAPPAHPLTVTLGGQIQLLGYDLPAAPLKGGLPFSFALHWQAVALPTADYTVFTQLIGPDGQVWAQHDNQPQAGRFPTTTWFPYDPVIDRYTLTLPESAPPGEYRLLVGMYDLTTGQRMPALAENDAPLADHAIHLTTLTLPQN